MCAKIYATVFSDSQRNAALIYGCNIFTKKKRENKQKYLYMTEVIYDVTIAGHTTIELAV